MVFRQENMSTRQSGGDGHMDGKTLYASDLDGTLMRMDEKLGGKEILKPP